MLSIGTDAGLLKTPPVGDALAAADAAANAALSSQVLVLLVIVSVL